jgi:hypothetical protein
MKKRRRITNVPIRGLEPDPRFGPPLDQDLLALMDRVARGAAPSRRTVVPVVGLTVHHRPTLERTRVMLREEPSLVASVEEHLPEAYLLVYRNDLNHLVVFDDYVQLAVGQQVGRERIGVQILGEEGGA